MSLDRIEITPFAVIAGEILHNRQTGHLTIIRGASRMVLYWAQGEPVMITGDGGPGLAAFLISRAAAPAEQIEAIFRNATATEVVGRFHESGLLPLSARQTLLRDWLTSRFIPLFSLEDGTAAFTDGEPLDASQRVFVQSTAALMLEGARSITSGLVLRRSLGDINRDIEPATESRYGLESIALTEHEQRIASTLTAPQTIEAFLKHFPNESLVAARVVIGMLALGVFRIPDIRAERSSVDSAADTQRDLELLAAIGSNDPRSFRAVALSRQLASMDHYQFLNLARAAPRTEITATGDAMKRDFDPLTYPPAARDAVQIIVHRIEEAVATLHDAVRRIAYDKLLGQPGGAHDSSGEQAIRQRAAQRSVAIQNYSRARQLSSEGDYYGAIVLLKQAVQFSPEFADAWFLLGSCQERNPKWRREAVESFQRALSTDPEHVDAMISLGDLYRSEGLTTRAQVCYEDALKIAPENQQAASRLQSTKRP